MIGKHFLLRTKVYSVGNPCGIIAIRTIEEPPRGLLHNERETRAGGSYLCPGETRVGGVRGHAVEKLEGTCGANLGWAGQKE